MKSFLFTAPILKAKLGVLNAGKEVQTRRLTGLEEINKEQWELSFMPMHQSERARWVFQNKEMGKELVIKPRYFWNDVCYIREAYSTFPTHYKLDGYTLQDGEGEWHTPMFMPANLARYFVRITNVWCERFYLQKLTPRDIELEGGEPAVNYLKTIDGKFVFIYGMVKVRI